MVDNHNVYFRKNSRVVALKMHNLAHYDSELRKRIAMAMAHGNKLDASIWDELRKNWENCLAKCGVYWQN